MAEVAVPVRESPSASEAAAPTRESPSASEAAAGSEGPSAAAASVSPTGPRTTFAAVADLFREAWVVDGGADGETAPGGGSGPQDALLPKFFEAAEVYLEVLSKLGKAVNLVVADVSRNLAGSRAAFLQDPAARSTLRSFLQAELQSGGHHIAPNGATKLKNPSGACQLQWLLRGLEFLLTMLKMLFEGDRGAPQRAYSQTLQLYHGRMTSLGAKAALTAVPSRETISGMAALCPELADDKERLAELVNRDVPRAAESGLPLVLKMVELFREVQLWETRQV